MNHTCTCTSDTCPPIRSAVDLHRYEEFVPSVLPGLIKQRPKSETAGCHHALLQRDMVQALHDAVQRAHHAPLWAVFRDVARTSGGRASEYELYHAFCCRSFAERLVSRPLSFKVVGDLQGTLGAPPAVDFVAAHSHLCALSEKELRDREGIINGDVQKEIARVMSHGRPELTALLGHLPPSDSFCRLLVYSTPRGGEGGHGTSQGQL